MTTVTIGVASAEDSKKRLIRAMESGQPQGEFISFSSMEALWGALTPKRWDLIQALLGKGATGIRELARMVDRDVKAVHTDAQALVACGVIDKHGDGKVEFPYDAVHVDFVVRAA